MGGSNEARLPARYAAMRAGRLATDYGVKGKVLELRRAGFRAVPAEICEAGTECIAGTPELATSTEEAET